MFIFIIKSSINESQEMLASEKMSFFSQCNFSLLTIFSLVFFWVSELSYMPGRRQNKLFMVLLYEPSEKKISGFCVYL